MRSIFNSIRLLAAALAVAITPTIAGGVQAYPTRPIRIIVPFEAGGGSDLIARTLAPVLTRNLGQTAYIENRPGAAGIIGIEVAGKASPDGYTLLLTPSAFTILPSFYKTRYDPIKDFAPISLVSQAPYVLVVNPSLPVTNVAEFIALARSRPGQLNFGSAGSGTAGNLLGELFKTMAHVDMVHIPYKGGAAAQTALMAGEVQAVFGYSVSVNPHVRSGRLRALAVTSSEPANVVPGVPTLASCGFSGFQYQSWNGLFAPAGTPPDVIARIHSALVASLATVHDRLESDGSEVVGDTPAQFTELIRSEVPRWKGILTQSGVKH